jgi:hypothetical protein
VDPSNHLLAKDKRFKIILPSGDEGVASRRGAAKSVRCCIKDNLLYKSITEGGGGLVVIGKVSALKFGAYQTVMFWLLLLFSK